MLPILCLIFQFCFTVLITGFTSPTSSWRLVGLFPVTLASIIAIPSCLPYLTRTPWAALFGGYSVTYLYHYLDIMLLSRWSFRHNAPISGLVQPSRIINAHEVVSMKPTQEAILNDTILARLLFGLKLTSSFRFVGTPFEVRNTPRPKVTERNHFLWRTLAVIILSYIILDGISSMQDSEISAKYLGLDKIPLLTRLHEVTGEELVIRSFTTLAAAIGLNCVQGGVYNIFALLAVAFRISEPKEWPPFYGSPLEAYNLKRFWNVFWHQTNARKFGSIARYTVHNVCRLSHGTSKARYMRIVVAFLASGIMHLLDDLASGVQLRNSGAMQFFLAQSLGLVLEDVTVKIFHFTGFRFSDSLRKLIGFIWVAVFLVWTVPAYMYPIMWRANLGLNDSVIPYSLFWSSNERAKALQCFLGLAFVVFIGTFTK